MKTAKVIIGLVVGFFATITISQMFFEETGAGLYGALSGYVVIIAICIWLIYSGAKVDSKARVIKSSSKNVTNSTFDKSSSLKDLKEKGLLTEQEYKEKLVKVENENAKTQIKETSEYQQLKDLLDNEVLTKEEFKFKIEKLKSVLRKERESLESDSLNREVKTNKGMLVIIYNGKANISIGDRVYLEGKSAPDGKYIYGWASWNEYITIENGVITRI